MSNTQAKNDDSKRKSGEPSQFDKARVLWKWIMGDMPLTPGSKIQGSNSQRRRISGSRRDRALTGRPAPDFMAKAWEWIIAEQPLKVKGPKTQSEDPGSNEPEEGGATSGTKIRQWIKGVQPLGALKQKKAKPLKIPKSGKTRKVRKLLKWRKKHKPELEPLIDEDSQSTRSRHGDSDRPGSPLPSDVESILEHPQDRAAGHVSDNGSSASLGRSSGLQGADHSDNEPLSAPPAYTSAAP